MTGLSLSQKLGIAGAFLVLVAMAIGTEEAPGIVAASTGELALRRPTAAGPALAGIQQFSPPASVTSAPAAAPVQAPDTAAPPPPITLQNPLEPSDRPAPQIDLPPTPEPAGSTL